MTPIKNIALILLCFFFFKLRPFAQIIERNLISSSGGFIQNSQGSISFSIGEPAIISIQNGQNTLTQGFQQPTNVKDRLFLGVIPEGCDFLIYPNPTDQVLNYATNQQNYYFEIYSIDGRNFGSFKLQNGSIDVNFLPVGTYLIKMICSEKNIKYHKFIKY